MNNKNIKDNFVIDSITKCQLEMTPIEQKTQNLYDAIADNDLILAQIAIENGADINAAGEPCTEGEDTPLDWAAYWANTYDCSLEMIELLRFYGATSYDLDKIKFLEEAEKCILVKPIQKKKSKFK